MPELCEVQIMTENLQKWTKDRRISSIEVLDSKLQGSLSDPTILEDKEIGRSYRRAKYTVQEIGEYSLVIHFRMTGKVVLEEQPRKHVRFRWNLDDNTSVVFQDTRRFGTMELMKSKEVASFFTAKKLGEEFWPQQRDGKWWQGKFSSSSQSLKAALLRQDYTVGIGNILASEFCFRAGLDPRKKCSSVSLEEWTLFARCAHSCIDDILEEERSEEIGYVNEGNQLPNSFKVYGRKGEECSVCSSLIESFSQNGRSSYWCPNCQS